MFIRSKTRGNNTYLQIVENSRTGDKVRQHVICSLGRLDDLQNSGKIDALLASGLKFCTKLRLLHLRDSAAATTTSTKKIGPVLLFERLWKQCGIPEAIGMLSRDRYFGFDLERALFVTVLHRLIAPGSDRAAEQWMRRYAITGADGLKLQHFYRAMAWLGEPLADQEQNDATAGPRTTKDRIEELLYAQHRDLFSNLSLVFFDTTSLYFEGDGGESLGQYGHSKDHRPDLRQLVVGVVLDQDGRPICSEIWPGNTTDVKALIPVATRLKNRFGIERVCIVADRGMISADTVNDLEELQWAYILGARMRRMKEVSEDVLSRGGQYHEVHGPRKNSHDPAPLAVKEVFVEDRRYIVCLNEEERRKDAHDREAILDALQEQLLHGDKSLVGNKGYRRYLKQSGGVFEIDEQKIEQEKRYDGKWVLRTNTTLSPAEVALQYKNLWMVEDIFRTMKSILESRPIFHRTDSNITGHVFCSFLAVVLRKALLDRLEAKGVKAEWSQLIEDVDLVQEVSVDHEGQIFTIRTEASGVAGKVFQAAGIALPPVVRET